MLDNVTRFQFGCIFFAGVFAGVVVGVVIVNARWKEHAIYNGYGHKDERGVFIMTPSP